MLLLPRVEGEPWLRRIRPVATRVRRPELYVGPVLLACLRGFWESGVDGLGTTSFNSELGVSTESLAELPDSRPLDACRVNGRSKLRALRFGAKVGLVDAGATALDTHTSALGSSLGLTEVVVRAAGTDCTTEELDLICRW